MNIDQSDDEFNRSEDERMHDRAFENDEQSFSDTEEISGHSPPSTVKQRRLGVKTAPIEVSAFPLRPLLNHAKYKVLQHKLKTAKRKQVKAARMIRTESVRLLSLNHVREEEGFHEYELPAPTQIPHHTHHITTLGGDQGVIWCKGCGCWSLSSQLKGLAKICDGARAKRASTVRLLQCGIVPVAGARLPINELKKRRNTSRW